MKYRKGKKNILFFKENYFHWNTTVNRCVFLGGWLGDHAYDCKDHSQGEQILHWTHPEPHVNYRKKPNLPDPDKSKLKTACLDKSRFFNQAAPMKLIPRARSPAGHFLPLGYSNDVAILDQQATQTIRKKNKTKLIKVRGMPRVFLRKMQGPSTSNCNNLHLPGSSK